MPRTWTAFTKLVDQAPAEALGEAMEALDPEPVGIGVFEIEDGAGLWEVGGYFTEAPDTVALAVLAAAYDADPFVTSEVPDTDWVDKVRRELTPVQAGRFFVHGAHDAESVPEGAVPLLIEAAMAFGTGHHGTTVGCLRALDGLDRDGFTGTAVADIGCGTAVLAMAAARIWPGTVMASDIDAVAVEVASANVVANGLAGRVICAEGAGFDAPGVQAAAPFDLVFANILKQPLIDLAPDMARHLQPGGYAILSGLLLRQADAVIRAYSDRDIALEIMDEVGDWATLTLRKLA